MAPVNPGSKGQIPSPSHGGTIVTEKIRCLKGLDISAQKYTKEDLHQVSFVKSFCRKTNFHRANLERANFHGADCERANFTNADCRNAMFLEANLKHTHFNEADLRGADLAFTDLTDARLSCADLRNANLFGATWHGASFHGARGFLPLPVADPRGYMAYACLKKGEVRICSGCRDFTIREAFSHWNIDTYLGEPYIGELYFNALEWMESSKYAQHVLRP